MTSRFGLAALATLLATGLAGCSTETTGNDAGMAIPDAPAQADAPSMTTEDAPSMTMEDAPSMTMEDAPSMMMADSPSMMMSASWADVHGQLTMRCAPCHSTGSSGGHSMAQADVAMAYADSQLSANACAGITKGACAAMRVRAGTMPPGGISDMTAREALADLLDSWVAGGQVGP